LIIFLKIFFRKSLSFGYFTLILPITLTLFFANPLFPALCPSPKGHSDIKTSTGSSFFDPDRSIRFEKLILTEERKYSFPPMINVYSVKLKNINIQQQQLQKNSFYSFFLFNQFLLRNLENPRTPICFSKCCKLFRVVFLLLRLSLYRCLFLL
jgi:hypothetical protein